MVTFLFAHEKTFLQTTFVAANANLLFALIETDLGFAHFLSGAKLEKEERRAECNVNSRLFGRDRDIELEEIVLGLHLLLLDLRPLGEISWG